jgi:spermidine synthase
VGCILGPLLAGFVLLPVLSERASMMILLAPFAVAALIFFSKQRAVILAVEAAALAALAIVPKSYERLYPPEQVVRDDTATTIARGKGMDRELLVNGLGMTTLTPSTKIMAHLPSSILPHGPRNALVICFGMGTTFRSFMSWGIPVTAVELVPKVPALFHYFHPDAPQLFADPNAHVVTDDGRRFLANSKEQFDVIVIDPPPPVSAASSSLLYSTEFYALIKAHLAPGGILQQWIPGGDEQTLVAFVRALTTSFPYTSAYAGLGFGVHVLASETPLVIPSPEILASRMPPKAVADLIEWGPYKTPQQQLGFTLGRKLPIIEWLAKHPEIEALDDDLPVNEYYLLRRVLGH